MAVVRRVTADEDEAFRFARVRALDRAPYFVPALYGLLPWATVDAALASSDSRGRIYLDMAAFAGLPVATQAGILVHEALHVLRHHARRGQMMAPTRPSRWTVATELEVNDDVVELGLVLPEGALTPALLGLPSGQTAEWYFAQKALDRFRPKGCAGRCGANGEHDCGVVAGGFCGGCAWQANIGAQDRRPGLDEVEVDVLRVRVAESMRRHASSRGALPGGMRRWLAELDTPPVVDWRRELRSALRSSVLAAQRGRTDYSRRQVSRRAENTETAPGMVQYLPTVAFGIDTSASMTDADLAAGIAELDGVCSQVGLGGGRVAFFSVDTAASVVRPVRSVSQVDLAGGGGTDMRVAFQVADSLVPRPDVFVLVTDGETPWPERPPPRMRCLVLTTNQSGVVPTWARRIVLG